MIIGFDGYYIDKQISAWGNTELNLLRNLAQIDKSDIFYVFTSDDGCAFFKEYSNIRCIILEKTIRDNAIFRTRSILRACRKNSIRMDIYIETCEISPRFKYPVRIFSLEHDFSQGTQESPLSWSHILGLIYRHLHLRSIKRANVLFCNSSFTLRQLKPYLSKGQTATVFPHGCDEVFNREPSNDPSIDNMLDQDCCDGFFLYVGRIQVRHKNLPMLLRAFSQLSRKFTSTELVIVSSQSFTRRQKNLIRKLGIKPILLNSLPSEHIVVLYRRAIALVVPSTYEGFGIPIIEAQSLGCPLILNDIDVFREVAGDGALFFNGTLRDLQEKMEYALNKENLKEFVAIGKMNHQKFSWYNTADIIHSHIRAK